jgi:hypothetical protein
MSAASCALTTLTCIWFLVQIMAILISFNYLSRSVFPGVVTVPVYAAGVLIETCQIIVILMITKYDNCLNFICVNLGECSDDDEQNCFRRLFYCRYCLRCAERLLGCPVTCKTFYIILLGTS